MSPDREERIQPLLRVVEALRGLERYSEPDDRESFLADPARQRAVEVRMGLLAGHASAVPTTLVEDHPRLPWQRLRALQDALAVYGSGEPERAWAFLVNQVSDFLQKTERLVEGLRAEMAARAEEAADPGDRESSGRVLHLRRGRVAVVRLPSTAGIPEWFSGGSPGLAALEAAIRTSCELTLYLPEERVPHGIPARGGYRVLELEGPLPFEEVGVLESLVGPLARGGVPVLALSTHDTDLILLQQLDVERAIEQLTAAGASVRRPEAHGSASLEGEPTL